MSPQQIKEWRSDVAMYDSAYAALYYPWIKVENPIGINGNAEILIPPSRPRRRRLGPHRRHPRRVEGPGQRHHARRASTSSAPITQNEQSLLNPIGINCIRPFGTRGIRIWGARTLASDTDWNYINVRRLFNMVEATILEGTQWAVFEPNDMALWEGVKRTAQRVPARPVVGRRAVRRQSADQAFYVKCDARPTRRSRSTRACWSSRSASRRSSRPSSWSSASARRSRSPADAGTAVNPPTS